MEKVKLFFEGMGKLLAYSQIMIWIVVIQVFIRQDYGLDSRIVILISIGLCVNSLGYYAITKLWGLKKVYGYLFVPIWLVINIVLTFCDQVGIIDWINVGMNLWILIGYGLGLVSEKGDTEPEKGPRLMSDTERASLKRIDESRISLEDFEQLNEVYISILEQDYSEEAKKYQYMTFVLSGLITLMGLGLIDITSIDIVGVTFEAIDNILMVLFVFLDCIMIFMLFHRWDVEHQIIKMKNENQLSKYKGFHDALVKKTIENDASMKEAFDLAVNGSKAYQDAINEYVFDFSSTKILNDKDKASQRAVRSIKRNEIISLWLPVIIGLITVVVFGSGIISGAY